MWKVESEMFTVPEIAEIGYKKFEIDTEDTEAFQKQIRKVIEEKIKNGTKFFNQLVKRSQQKKLKILQEPIVKRLRTLLLTKSCLTTCGNNLRKIQLNVLRAAQITIAKLWP